MQWTEITQDNVEELYTIPSERIVVAHEAFGFICYKMSYKWLPSLNTMAKHGGYYYIELPELKINENKNE